MVMLALWPTSGNRLSEGLFDRVNNEKLAMTQPAPVAGIHAVSVRATTRMSSPAPPCSLTEGNPANEGPLLVRSTGRPLQALIRAANIHDHTLFEPVRKTTPNPANHQ